MGKNLLIIGGTYFTGRIFAILAARAGHRLTFLNRGKYSMKNLGDIREYACDRHDIPGLRKLRMDEEYDAVIDFCAYEPGDIRILSENLSCVWKQYIYLSTADVYAREPGIKTEDSKLMQKEPEDRAELYAYKKMLLEQELAADSFGKGYAYTILRPAFIFGPYNYAPRESWYIRRIVRGEPLYEPSDARGQFQMVYVKDVGEAICLCIGSRSAENQRYNLSAPDILDYSKYMELLEGVSDKKFQTVNITVNEVFRQRIPLPFPLTEEESELFDGSKIVRDLGFAYSDLKESMKLTFHAFRGVYEQKRTTPGRKEEKQE